MATPTFRFGFPVRSKFSSAGDPEPLLRKVRKPFKLQA